MAESLETMAPWCTSFLEPIAKVVVVTISIAAFQMDGDEDKQKKS
jgi:hypothetical protein